MKRIIILHAEVARTEARARSGGQRVGSLRVQLTWPGKYLIRNPRVVLNESDIYLCFYCQIEVCGLELFLLKST